MGRCERTCSNFIITHSLSSWQKQGL